MVTAKRYRVRPARQIAASDMWSRFIDPDNIRYSYMQAKKGSIKFHKKTADVNFMQGVALEQIRLQLLNGLYKFGGYTLFYIRDKKQREVWVPSFRDKIVQVMLCNVLTPLFWHIAIDDTYACIKGRGTDAAVQKIWHYQRRALQEYGQQGVFLKLDISKFFYTINREILMEKLAKDVWCPFTYRVLCKCIDSYRASHVGLPLGNVISQHLANYYLNDLDHWVKRKLKVKYYVRYADDFFLFLPTRERAREVRDAIAEYVNTRLLLVINPVKTYITPIHVVHGLGKKILLDRIELLSRNKRSFKHMLRHKDVASLNSWYGTARSAKVHGFIRRATANSNFIFNGRRFYNTCKEMEYGTAG